MLNPQAKNELIYLLEMLPEKEIRIVKMFVEFVLSQRDQKILKAFSDAPEDDEPLTEEDLGDIQAARKASVEGRVVSLEQVRQELGL